VGGPFRPGLLPRFKTGHLEGKEVKKGKEKRKKSLGLNAGTEVREIIGRLQSKTAWSRGGVICTLSLNEMGTVFSG